MRAALILLYLAAIAAANLIITSEGIGAAPYVALGLIAFDLVARDVLHDRTAGRQRIAVMALLVVGGSVIAYAINADARNVAIASAAAFALALTADALVYHASRYLPWLERSTRSNVASAVIDSAVFLGLLAALDSHVNGFPWGTFVVQSGMKIAGGALFAIILARLVERTVVTVHERPAVVERVTTTP